ncbi:glycoside hydrolase family 43 protein (plasmid) [Deinococcus sp. KNUC1210]|uniref:glycoside hydrolase family 43 protein n=1 Tax=Deinococcus sp. KNUC1210 TaxID=2917691 RepID=UPI001EF04A41|nr:glycoside hydrolase family 43 protein [Deinococcus sp. KNUC1210]ULH17260.1 glycoside hydrolase family 43 protein [Deinococcus sp. KNUC1210]
MNRVLKVRALLAALLTSGTLLLPSGTLAGGSGAPVAAATFKNPVLDINFPDPFILKAGNVYHAYATNGVNGNVQHAESRDLTHWKVVGDALPTLPDWAQPGLTWAPEVSHLGGKYQLYFTARDLDSDKQCVGVAVSGSPAGPFTPAGRGPIVCQVSEGGSIDPSPFVDSGGAAYLLWKNDGNCCGLPTRLYLQKLSADGLHLTGKPNILIQNDQAWEGRVVEAPTLHKQGGVYYLLYSGGAYDSSGYAVGYATSTKVGGPYRQATENPVLVSRGVVAGPGHQSVFSDAGGQTWLVYHAWTNGLIGDSLGYRSMRLDRVTFSSGRVKVSGPTTTPQPAPRP